MITDLGDNKFCFFFGKVEDIKDPLQLGRVKVRVFGYQEDLDIEDLNWATVMLPATSASLSGVGQSPTGLLVGSYVIGFFMDSTEKQIPIIMGTFCKIPDMNESLHDVNKLARGINSIGNELIGPEPQTSYASEYPYNKVTQTSSGHIFEIDDTPGASRIHARHKSGSYQEISETGRRVNKIIDDDIEIILKDKTLYVKGNLSIEVQGNVNINTSSDCIVASRNAKVNSSGNVSITGKKISLNG